MTYTATIIYILIDYPWTESELELDIFDLTDMSSLVEEIEAIEVHSRVVSIIIN